ncbi:MAG: chorismate-binding protein [Prevotella sp.]|nr:chorismate-binding protein [Prevotella sp.]
MSSIALFRLPHAQTCTLILQKEGLPQTLDRLTMLDDCRGYVFAPFASSSQNPILLLRPDVVETYSCDDVTSKINLPGAHPTGAPPNLPQGEASDSPPLGRGWGVGSSGVGSSERFHYHLDFCNFHAQLCEGTFRKIVLARSTIIEKPEPQSPIHLFQKACARYPRMFISLVSTPQGGTWLTASPEILLEERREDRGEMREDSRLFKTIALAGTADYSDDVRWSEKNIREQRYVATYMMETLEQFSNDIAEEGPCTVRAANLAHLRSDFNFRLDNTHHLGSLLHALHPTPAVCGLPKRDAFNFILRNESMPRGYYSGFQGPLDVDGMTHLYVSLRCMSIHGNRYRLYAGGGLLSDSDEESEWNETEAKLNTMRYVLE